MRPEMKSSWNEISTHHKRNCVYFSYFSQLLFIAGEMIWISFPGWSELNVHSVKVDYSCLRMYRCFVSYGFVSGSVDMIFYHSKLNFISVKMTAINNTHDEFHFGLYHVNSNKKLTRHRNENISFRPKWNSMWALSKTLIQYLIQSYLLKK